MTNFTESTTEQIKGIDLRDTRLPKLTRSECMQKKQRGKYGFRCTR